MEPEDLLNYENEYEIKRKLGNEKIYYTDKIVKKKGFLKSHRFPIRVSYKFGL